MLTQLWKRFRRSGTRIEDEGIVGIKSGPWSEKSVGQPYGV